MWPRFPRLLSATRAAQAAFCPCELCHNARRSLQAEHLRPALAAVEARTPPRCTAPVSALRPLAEHFKSVPDYRSRIGSYPLWSLLSIVACAHLADAPRGQKDLAKFAAGLNHVACRVIRGRFVTITPTEGRAASLYLGLRGSLNAGEIALKRPFQTRACKLLLSRFAASCRSQLPLSISARNFFHLFRC